MGQRSLICVGGLLALVAATLSQPLALPGSYYYSGGARYGYGADPATLAAAAVAGYPYTDSYYYNPATWTNFGYPSFFTNPYFDWGSYLPGDQTGWNSFVSALPMDLRTSWNSYYRSYGVGVPNAANLWGRFLGQLPTNLFNTWQNWWGKNYTRRFNTIGPEGATTTYQSGRVLAVPGVGLRATRTLTDILRRPNGFIDNYSSDPFSLSSESDGSPEHPFISSESFQVGK